MITLFTARYTNQFKEFETSVKRWDQHWIVYPELVKNPGSIVQLTDADLYQKFDSENCNWIDEILNLAKNSHVNIITKSSIIFNGFRLLLAQDKIRPENFRVVFTDENESHIIHFNESACTNDWPYGLFEQDVLLSEKIMRLSLKKRGEKYEALRRNSLIQENK